MSKVKTILSAAVVLMGTLGNPNLVTRASAETAQLYENVNNEFFRIVLLNPYAGTMRLRLTIPEGKTLKRVVLARPGEDRYRLMPELDAAALKILDGEVEGLVLHEQQNPGMAVLGQVFDSWVGFSFYDYEETGLRFLERNPADVMYVGVVLWDEAMGETRYYYKVNYRSCAHQQTILDGEVVLCDAQHDAGVTYFVPDGSTSLSGVPTWEEELLALAKNTAEGYFDDLEAIEAVQEAGGEISSEQVEVLEARGEELGVDLAKFPELAEIEAMRTDYAMRVEALRKAVGSGQGSGSDGLKELVTPVKPTVPGVASSLPGVQGVVGVQNGAEVQNIGGVQSTSGIQDALQVQDASGDISDAEQGEQAPVFGAVQVEDREEMAVPKLGGSWLERYWLALLIAGASVTGVVGWFLIGVLGKKRKHNDR